MIPVHWDVEAGLSATDRCLVEQSIALQPQPAYQAEAGRVYGAQFSGWNVRWTLIDGTAHIVECESR